ncbi:MAG: DUF115 domain-containing protein, partial [Spirochaetes bacterium]|nr:DUF115 domain-containing protein [Spirochaetota bacterium]
MEPSGPLLVDTGRGLSIRYMDRWLYSRRDPTAAPLEAARSAAILPDTLYLAPSPCLCYGLAELVSRLPASSAALCVETDPRLRAIASRAVSEGLRAEAASGRVALCETREALSAYRALEAAVAARRFRRVVEVRLSGGRTVDERGYDGAIASVEADIGSRYRNRLSLVRMGRLWTKNLIANLGAMDWASVGPLRSGGKPVVACGAGPSLDSAIPYLRAARDSVFLLACDTAAGALAAAGLAPDAVVCLEGQVYNVADFLPLGAAASDEASPRAAVPGAVVDLSAHPSSFRALSGPKALTLSEWTDSAFLSRLSAAGLPVSAVPPLGSVGVLALRVAASLGGPIVVAGLDFSFYQGRTHCAGSPADLLSRRSETRTCKSAAAWDASFRDGRSRNGDGSLSDPALSMYASLAASELRLAAEQGVAAYDA